MNAVAHYVLNGRAAGLRPSPYFDGTRIDMDVDMIKSIITVTKLFNNDWYRYNYRDVAKRGTDPLDHYVKFGALEGRAPNGMFDPQFYQAQAPEIAELDGSAGALRTCRNISADRSTPTV